MLTTGVMAAPVLLSVKSLFAATAPVPKGKKKLDENAPMAKVLGFKHDASKVNTAVYKKYQPGQNCANCTQYVKVDDNYGTCKVIAGGLVASAGWCNSYLLKKA